MLGNKCQTMLIISSMGKQLLLRSDLNEGGEQYDVVLNWNSCQQGDYEYSIPLFIEEHSDQFKDQYLDWIYRFGKTKLGDKDVIEHLLIRSDFSLWSMSLLFEKSKWKSPDLYQVFQLMAFEEILKSIEYIESIDIKLDNTSINQSISTWCLDNGIRCNNTYIKKYQPTSTALGARLFSRLPYVMQAFIWLFRHILLRKTNKPNILDRKQTDKTKRNVCFMSYFFNLDMDKIQKGRFGTRYWTALHELLVSTDLQVSWIHLFEKSRDCNHIKQARALVDNLNKNNQSEFHTLVEQYISAKVLMKTLKDYFKGVISGVKINKGVRKYFKITDSSIDFYPVLSGDWRCSLFGKTAISGCLYLNIFEQIFRELPTQSQGFYLMENQSWERSMIYAWKKNGHGSIVGVPHTIVSYWDLRHCYSASEYIEGGAYMPDLIAVNGSFSEQMYLSSNIPRNKLYRVEALRYLYLSHMSKSDLSNNGNRIRLLILGDCDADIVRKQMQFATDCLKLASHPIELLVKPHPLSPIALSDFPKVSFTVVTDPLNELVEQYEVALASNPTAAAVDAHLSGKKTLIMLDCTSFNISPLKGCDNVHFVTKAAEFWSILNNFDPSDRKIKLADFFDLDLQLPRWRKLLDL